MRITEVVCEEAQGFAEGPRALQSKQHFQTLSVSDLERHHDPVRFASATERADSPTFDFVACAHRDDSRRCPTALWRHSGTLAQAR